MARTRDEAFSGAVLAGGLSRRFGRDKAPAPYRGRALLLRVLDSLVEADERFVVSNRPRPFAGVPTRPDLVASGSALSGVHSALNHASHPWVAIAACDLPNLDPGFWRLLRGHRRGVQAVVVRHDDGRLEPLAALYHRSALPIVDARLQADRHSLHDLIGALETCFVDAGEILTVDAFRNINRPEDLPGSDGS